MNRILIFEKQNSLSKNSKSTTDLEQNSSVYREDNLFTFQANADQTALDENPHDADRGGTPKVAGPIAATKPAEALTSQGCDPTLQVGVALASSKRSPTCRARIRRPKRHGIPT